ncbi:hypothetical protein LguiA_026403 [Lonicera macranthoides]
MEEDVWFEEDSNVGTSNLFKGLNLASTKHVSYTPMTEHGNTKESLMIASIPNTIGWLAISFAKLKATIEVKGITMDNTEKSNGLD